MASAAPTKISPSHWRVLIDRIHNGRCVPFLGAGVNASTKDYLGLPLGNEVTLRLIEGLVGRRVSKLQDLIEVKVDPILAEHEGLVPENLLELSRVAEYYRQATDEPFLLSIIQDILNDRDREPSRILQILADLPFTLIVTCNYDRLMERALEKAGAQFYVVVQPILGFDPPTAFRLQQELPGWNGCVLYKLHGGFRGSGDEPAEFSPFDIVLTEDDYLVFMGTLMTDDRGMPLYIKAQLARSSLLFLGYSLQDWDWRMFYGLLTPHDGRLAISIQKDPPLHLVRYWKNKRLVIYNVDLDDFAQELSSRFAAAWGH